jgi:hypothetical protein
MRFLEVVRPRIWLIPLTLLLFWPTVSKADEMTLVKSGDPIIREYAGHPLDVLGMAPGMSAAEAKKRIAQAYETDPAETMGALVMRYRSISMSSQDYLSELKASKEQDTMTVYLGTPSTGNVVVGIERKIVYSDPTIAPDAKTLVTQLQSKYGTTSAVIENRPLLRMQWVFNASAFSKCPSYGCVTGLGALNPGALDTYLHAISDGHQVTIQADIQTSPTDQTRVGNLTITVEDVANKAKTLSEAFKQIQAAAQAAYDKEALPQRGPKL